MADIIKIYTAEQLYAIYRNYLLSKNVGLTDFNSGSKIRSLIESNSEVISSISMDFKESIYKSIPVALYEGFRFQKTAAIKSTGFIRPYRKPAFFITYTGAGTSAKITSTATDILSAVTGAPTDAFSFDYTTYNTIGSVVSAIDALINWSATLVLDTSLESIILYQYAAKEALNASNYLDTDGLDIMLNTAIEIAIPTGYSVSIDQLTFLSIIDGTISAGNSGVQLNSQASLAGVDGNILAGSIDTLNGKGFINSSIEGIEQVINDASFSGGAAGESDDARKTRFAETVNSLNAGTATGIIAAIKSITGVRSVGIRESYPFKGTNTIIVDDGTGIISTELQAEVEKVLYGDPSDIINFPGKNAEGIGYNIVAPTIVDVSIGLTAYRLPNVNVDLSEITEDVQTAVEQYINTRGLGEDVVLSEANRVGKNSNAAVYDLVVTSPSSNVTIDENQFSKTGPGTTGVITVTAVIAASV